MTWSLRIFVLAAFLGATLETAVAQPKFRYICAPDQRAKRSFNGGPWHYCFDGFYYSEKTVPPHVVKYFEDQERESKEFWRKEAELREKSRRESMALHEAALSSQRSPRSPYRPTSPVSGGVVEASVKPEPKPVSKEKVRSIEAGATRESVIGKLGEPHGKVVNSTDPELIETWTYIMEGGAFGSVRLKAGSVVAVRLPE